MITFSHLDGNGLNLNPNLKTGPTLRQLRQELVDNSRLCGSNFCLAYSNSADSWLSSLFLDVVGDQADKLALVAVGGFGRRELCPGSDLDVLLLHHPKLKNVKKIADSIWYPVWDQGVHLDHSVRTPKQVTAMAKDDLKVLLGLLDGRVIVGNQALADDVLGNVLELWRQNVANSIGQLLEIVTSRHLIRGEVAYMLEPDLKEDRGGLRDLHAISCLGKALIEVGEFSWSEDLEQAKQILMSVRVEIQRLSGKETNLLTLQDQDLVASRLSLASSQVLMDQIAFAGRVVSWNFDRASQIGHRRTLSSAKPVPPVLLARNLEMRDQEIWVVGQDGNPPDRGDLDCTLAVRAAVQAAQSGCPISISSLQLLADGIVAPPVPWPQHLLQQFVALLGMGKASISEIESLDQVGIFEKLIEEWKYVRHKPQRNAFHRFTVDRHLCETAAEAAEEVRSVSRPDLLLLGALLHDIGKGFPGDHTEVGIEVAGHIAERMGLPKCDIEIIQAMVAHHLLLPDTAAKRDLDDPNTIDIVASKVADPELLLLLGCLAKADSLATGPSMSSPWKLRMIDDLVGRVHHKLTGGQDHITTIELSLDETTVGLIEKVTENGLVAISSSLLADSDGWELNVVARDQVGLLARVTGVLSLNGLVVRSAQVSQAAPGLARESFVVESRFDRVPNWEKLQNDLEIFLGSDRDIKEHLEQKELEYAGSKRLGAALPAEPRVIFDNEASNRATIIEVRTPDAIGVLFRIASTLAELELNIITAKVQTLGHEVVDTFYVNKIGSSPSLKVLDETSLGRIQSSLLEALSSNPTTSQLG